MKNLILILALAMVSVGAFANVDAKDDPNHPGMKLVIFTGAKGTAAWALYEQLTAASQSVDNSTPNVVNTFRTGTALNCEEIVQDSQDPTYECSTDVTTAGAFQSN